MGDQLRSEEETLDQTSDENYELEKLEEDVELMAHKVAEFRDNLPDQLRNTLSAILSAQRPVNLNHSDNDPEPSSSNPNPNSESESLVEDDPAHAEKIQIIKQKMSSNASAMPSLLKKMKDCMSRFDKLDSNKRIHPAFKRRKIDCFT